MEIVEVGVLPLDSELRERVQPRLLNAPVEPIAPVVRKLAQIVDACAVRPGLAVRLIGKASALQSLAEIGEVAVGNVIGKPRNGSWPM